MAADVHSYQGGAKVVKLALSARASSERPNLGKIAEDNDFAVITTRNKQNKTKIKPTGSETAIN